MSEFMSLPAPPTPPGWYPNPSGGPDHRYWDGAHWWPIVDVVTAPTESAPATPMPKPPRTRPGKYKALGLAVGMLLAIIGGGVFIAAVSNNSASSNDATGTSSPAGSTPRYTPVPTTVSPPDLARQRARLDPANYQTLSPREFALITKDPDAQCR